MASIGTQSSARSENDGGQARGLKIVTVTHYFPSHGGGIELIAGRLAREVVARGALVDWFASNTDIPPPQTLPGLSYIPVRTCNILEQRTQLPYPLWTPAVIPRLWRAVGAADVVHVHEHLYLGSLLTLLIARLKGRPAVLTQHVGELRLRDARLAWLYSIATRLIGKAAFRLATRTAFISSNVQRFFGMQQSSKARLIFNGIDTKLFHPPSIREHLTARSIAVGAEDDRPLVLFVGRFVRKKGLHIIRQLIEQFPGVTWTLVGRGPERPDLWKYPNLKVIEQVSHQELLRYYHAADLLILPSSGEGLPLVVQEALATGLGALASREVATACPAAASMIRSCDADAPISSWSQALAATLRDSEYLDGRIERARRAEELWSLDHWLSNHLSLVSEAMQSRGTSFRS